MNCSFSSNKFQHINFINMITISTTARITKEQPYIWLEGVPEGFYKVVIILEPIGNLQEKKPPVAGFGKGKFEMSDDFNEPLKDFKDYL